MNVKPLILIFVVLNIAFVGWLVLRDQGQQDEQLSDVVDDLVATGGTAIACAELLTENFKIKKSNILILGVIDLPKLGGSDLIVKEGYNIQTLVSY